MLERKLSAQEEEHKEFSLRELRKKFNLKLKEDKIAYLKTLEETMFVLAKELKFEQAARVRDEMHKVRAEN